MVGRLRFNNHGRWLWVPAFAGTTARAATNQPVGRARRSLLTRRSPPSDEGGWRSRGKSLLIFSNPSSPGIKNISLHNSVNQNYNLACLAPTRGAYHDRHDTWGAGCGGRFGVRHDRSRRTKTPRGTAKSCGPDAAMLVLSWREVSRRRR